MIRRLSIVLDDNCNISRTLVSMDNYLLDRYIYDHFVNLEQVRNAFNTQIESFLVENKDLISNIEMTTNQKYRGQITILQVNSDETLKRLRIIYKSDVNRIKKDLLTDQVFMQKFVFENRRYFSDFIYYRTRRLQRKTPYNQMMRQFYDNIKENVSFFEFCRAILKFAELNNKSINNKVIEQSSIFNIPLNEDSGSFHDDIPLNEDSDSFHDDIPLNDGNPDLYERNYDCNMDDGSFIHPHEIEENGDNKKLSKIKLYKKDPKRNPNQLSFFD